MENALGNTSDEEVRVNEEIALDVKLEGTEEIEKQLDNIENRLDKIGEKADKVKAACSDDMKDDDEYEKPMAMSFAELEEMEKAAMQVNNAKMLTDTFAMLANNIMSSESEDKQGALVELANEYTKRVLDTMRAKERWQPLTDYVANWLADLRKQEKPMKTEDGVKYPKEDFAYTPSDQPSSWKLRMAEGRPGNITVAQLGRAAAAFSPGGFRGQKVEIPSGDVAAVKRRLRSEYEKLEAEIPESIAKENSLTVWKEADGTYRFLAVYSNNFRDSDNPPEIISSKSHQRFDDLLSKGQVPMPDLWLWHVPEWKIGQVTGHAYDDSGFALAYGVFDKGKEAIAEWLSKQDDIAVSHGMPNSSIVRDDNDASIIVEHITREISPLPAWAAANKLTSFVVLNKEADDVTIPENKRETLIAAGLSAETLAKVEEMNKDVAQQAKESGLEHKEETPVIETANESGAEEATSGDAVTPEVTPITREEVAEAISESTKEISDAVKVLIEQVSTLTKALAEQKEKEAKAPQPVGSILDLIRSQSAVGAKATELKEDELKTGVAEAKDAPPVVSPIPFINQLLTQKRQ